MSVSKVQTVSNHQWDVLRFVSKCPQTNCLERFPRTANHHKRRCLGSPGFQRISAYRIIKLRVRRAPSIGALWSGLRSSYVEHRIVIKMTIWWLNQPIWKICWIISPSRGENKTCWKPPPRCFFLIFRQNTEDLKWEISHNKGSTVIQYTFCCW